MAKKLNVSRADAYTAVADVWSMLAADAEGDIVKGWTLDMLDAVVEMEMAGCGAVMLQAGLVGVVDDGLVLPAELRHQQRDEQSGPAAAAADQGDGQNIDPKLLRRRESGKRSSRKYRRKNKLLGKKAKTSGERAWRSLGYVAGHEVRVFDGPHGCYAMVLGATVGGELFRKLTTGDKAWSLESVRLVDTLPGLLEKWKTVYSKESKGFAPKPLVPAYADFRNDAERLTTLAKIEKAAAEDARHADAADASSRHADASAPSAGPSANPDANGERKPVEGKGLDAADASADRHADALSSMSYPSKSSSSHEEEDMGQEGREAAATHEPGAAKSERCREWEAKRAKGRQLAERIAHALGLDIDTVIYRGRTNPQYLALQCREAGIDPRTGHHDNAEASHEPADARDDISTTTEPTTDDKGVAGSVTARGEGVWNCAHDDLRTALQQHGIPLPTTHAPPADDDAFEHEQTSAVGAGN